MAASDSDLAGHAGSGAGAPLRRWTCPRCGRQFANRNQAHSCTDLTVEEHLADRTPEAIAIYREVETAVGACGDFRLHPVKTRIAFINRMSFAGVTLRRRWVDVAFILARPLEAARVRKLELFGPTSWGHHIRLHHPEDVDDELHAWLADAYRRGSGEGLDGPLVPPGPLARTRMEAPFASKVVEGVSGPILEAPTYVLDALAARPLVSVRLPGRDTAFDAELAGDAAAAWVPVPHEVLVSAGLEPGDRLDAVVRPV